MSPPASKPSRVLPVVQVRLQFTALHLLLTLIVGAHHSQLVQQVPDQQAGGTALVQLQPLAIHGAEVLLFQEVAQTVKAIGVATRGVHRSEEGLQADVANQFIIHIILVLVQVALQAIVLLATLLTDPRPRQACSATAAGSFGFCCSHWLGVQSKLLCLWKRSAFSYLLKKRVWCTSRTYVFVSKATIHWNGETMIPSQNCYLHVFILIFCWEKHSKVWCKSWTIPTQTGQLHRKWQIHRAAAIWHQAAAASSQLVSWGTKGILISAESHRAAHWKG